MGRTAVAREAQKQLVGIAVTLSFVTLADSILLGITEFPWPAASSPGRQALTQAIDDAAATGKAILLTGDAFVGLLESAQRFYDIEMASPDIEVASRSNNNKNVVQLQDLDLILVEMSAWLEAQKSTGIDAIDDVSTHNLSFCYFP
jgi:hypothetical protein